MNGRPTRLGHWVSQLLFVGARRPAAAALGRLKVRDRVTDGARANAVVVPTVAGRRYIVSMFGTSSDGVHNLEASHGEAAPAHGGLNAMITQQTRTLRQWAVRSGERASGWLRE